MGRNFGRNSHLQKVRSTVAAICGFSLALPALATGALTPTGQPFNIDSLDPSAGTDDSTAVAMAADGSSVVAWATGDEENLNTAIMARRIAKDGTPLTANIVVDVPPESYMMDSEPRIASDASGNFVVVWLGPEVNGNTFSVTARMRIFNADGTPRTASACVEPSCSSLPGGVVMNNSGEVTALTSGPTFVNMLYQFNADGTAKASMPVSIDKSNSLNSDSLAINRQTGALAIASLQKKAIISGELFNIQHDLILLQRYDVNAAAVGLPTTVLSCYMTAYYVTQTSGCYVQGLSLAQDDSGSNLLAWQENDVKDKTDSDLIYVRGYSSSGKALGSKVAVSPQSSESAALINGAAVVAGPAGEFAVTWPIQDQTNPSNLIRSNVIQGVALDGTLNGTPYTALGTGGSASMDADNAGSLLLAWPGNASSPQQQPGIDGQLFSLN